MRLGGVQLGADLLAREVAVVGEGLGLRGGGGKALPGARGYSRSGQDIPCLYWSPRLPDCICTSCGWSCGMADAAHGSFQRTRFGSGGVLTRLTSQGSPSVLLGGSAAQSHDTRELCMMRACSRGPGIWNAHA